MSDTRDFDIEDTVILLDVSRSMSRKDFNPNRLEAVKRAILKWIKLKYKIDKEDRYAIISFSTNGRVVQDYTSDVDQILSGLNNLRIHGISALGEGIGLAVQFIGQKMAKAGDTASGGNVNRILLISDGKATLTSIDPLERANVAAELGIIVDCIEISRLESKSFGSILESMAILGEYYQIYDESLLELTIKSLSHKKDVFELKKTMPKLSLIAADLLDLSSLSDEMQKAVNELMGVKVNFCEICRNNNCPDHGIDCIRLCPYCKTAMHICCAQQWAEESKMIEAEVCRCPHCLFLLKLPVKRKPISKATPKLTTKVKSTTSKPPSKRTPKPSKPQSETKPSITSETAKIGEFIFEDDRIKLKIRHRGDEKFIYLAWDNWGKANYSCSIISGMSDVVCKEFHPIIDWNNMICTGFIIKDLIGWLSRLDQPSYGVLLFNLKEFELWCKNVIKDIASIKKLMKEHPEIKFSSDKIMDFCLEAEIKFDEPLEVSVRNSLEGNLLLGAMTYLNLFESVISEVKMQKQPTIETTPTSGPPAKPKSPLAQRLEKLDKIPINLLAEKLGMSNIKVESIILKMIKDGELKGTIKKGIFYRKK